MSIAVGLLLYSVAVLVAAPPLLRTLTSSGAVPRLGVAAWLTAIGTVLGTWLVVAAMVIGEMIRRWTHPRIVASCLARLQRTVSGDGGIVPQILVVVIVAAVTLAAAVIGVRLGRAVVRMRARAHEHAHAVRLVGHRTGEADVVMVESTKPAAYCIAGRPPAIVVTSAARAALDDRQLAAVLAHERAHVAGHHALIVTAMRGIAAVFPRRSLVAKGAQQVSPLLEMCADDVAVRRHSSRALLSALITLCAAAPTEALAAADLAMLARAERLAMPPQEAAKVRARAALASFISMMAAGPLIAAAILWRSQPKALEHNESGEEISMMMMDDGHWGWGSWILTTGVTVVFWARRAVSAVVVTATHRHESRRGREQRRAGACRALRARGDRRRRIQAATYVASPKYGGDHVDLTPIRVTGELPARRTLSTCARVSSMWP